MSGRLQTRPSSARRSNSSTKQTVWNSHSLAPGSTIILSCIDLRTTKQKIEDLENDIRESAPKQKLDDLVLMQVYTNLEYGDISIENARCYYKLSQFYFNRKFHLLPQAKFHALNARQILEQLNIQPSDDDLQENLLAYDIYLILSKCSLRAKQYFFQRETKSKNKHILSIDKSHIDHDLQLIEKYLDKLKYLISPKKYEKLHLEYLVLQFDAIVIDLKEFHQPIYELIENLEGYFLRDQIQRRIDLYLRSGAYLISFEDTVQNGLKYYRQAVDLADELERMNPSSVHKAQLANAILQRSSAKVRTDRLTDDLEKEFQRAIEVYRQSTGDVNKHVLKAIDELATFYTKLQKYQDALNVLCESLPDRIRLFGDFSEEVIQAESRIGTIYLREGECLNAAEHLQACLDLQEVVYGLRDSRTSETRNSIELLKKDPMVSRTFFARTSDGKRQDRPAFRMANRISHEREDRQFIQPPYSPKT